MGKTLALIVGGIASVFLILLGVAGICLGALRLADSLFPETQLRENPAITRADYQQCVTVIGPPLKPQKRMNGSSPNIHPEIV